MSDEVQTTEPIEQPEVSPEIQTILDAKVAEIEAKYSSQLKGLDRSNTKLQKELHEKDLAGKTIEERIAAIERDKVKAETRAATMEAFGRAGLSEDWRSLFDITDPEDRAMALKDLLEEHSKGIQKEVATQFVRDPEQPADNGTRKYTMAQLKGKSETEIKELMKEGRVDGF